VFKKPGKILGTLLIIISLSVIPLGPSTVETSSSVQPTNNSGSWNSFVDCIPQLTTVGTVTAGMVGNASLDKSPFYPGITNSHYGPAAARRWLTPSNRTPEGWTMPGPSCQFFVEIDNVTRGGYSYEDRWNVYEFSNGDTGYPGESNCGKTKWCGDFGFNICDVNITRNHCGTGECTNVNDTAWAYHCTFTSHQKLIFTISRISGPLSLRSSATI
jgi:hypothetical protein